MGTRMKRAHQRVFASAARSRHRPRLVPLAVPAPTAPRGAARPPQTWMRTRSMRTRNVSSLVSRPSLSTAITRTQQPENITPYFHPSPSQSPILSRLAPPPPPPSFPFTHPLSQLLTHPSICSLLIDFVFLIFSKPWLPRLSDNFICSILGALSPSYSPLFVYVRACVHGST